MRLPYEWRLQEGRMRMEGEACSRCGQLTFPARPVCPACGGREWERQTLSGRGEIYSYSTVYRPFADDSCVPYVVALIRLAEGPMVSAQLTDVLPEQVSIGMPVERVTRVLREDGPEGLLTYSYKFRPLLAQKTAL